MQVYCAQLAYDDNTLSSNQGKHSTNGRTDETCFLLGDVNINAVGYFVSGGMQLEYREEAKHQAVLMEEGRSHTGQSLCLRKLV
jgi:hypothetical protein